jgi:phage shock protein PspC (stress-responsive transcriptional regulator)
VEPRERRDDWTLILAIVLIALGGWMLLREFLGDFFPFTEVVKIISRVIWPMALIGAGVLIYLASKREGRPAQAQARRFYRSRTDRMVGGVLGGLGAYLGVDPTWLRVAFVLVAFAGVWPAVLIYIIAMVVVPDEPAGAAPQQHWPQTGGTETVQAPVEPGQPDDPTR